jgi:transcriptional regulator with XRE-family HTH domain
MADVASSAPERLRLRLTELGWSQTDLAKAIEVSTGVVSRWLSGDRVPSLDMAFRIQKSEVALPADAWVTHAANDDSRPTLAVDESGEHPAAPLQRHSDTA